METNFIAGGVGGGVFVTAFNTQPQYTRVPRSAAALSSPLCKNCHYNEQIASPFTSRKAPHLARTGSGRDCHRGLFTRHNVLPSPHVDSDTYYTPTSYSSADFLHTTTLTTYPTSSIHLHDFDLNLPSTLLSDSTAAAVPATSNVDPKPHHTVKENFKELFEEVIDEVEDEVKKEISGDNDGIVVTAEMEKASLNDVGHDLIVFLTICVVVAPLSSAVNISPVLLYLLFGFITGPYGLHILRGNEEVGFELGDFGILFLLFVEGLNLSPERLRELGSFFRLGATQLLFSVAVIFFGLFLGGPLLFQLVSNPSVPIDPLIVQLLEQPVVAFAIAAAGALSSSAFVLPILKEKGWEDRPDGIAALSILLLQDLAVAPLLVLLPLIADLEGYGTGDGGADPIALGVLAFKATVVFGGVLSLASVLLRKVFEVVASSRSSQSFVAASLLVAVGMGVISDFLGLSSTTGAFAAGVLLAESGYRAQIEADIQPFEGILLGVFFVTAGSALDPQVVIDCFPTLVTGILSFLAIKFSVIYSAGGALGISKADAARVGLLLAGGGEFAFVVFNLAADNGIIPDSLGSLLTASVIISMALTPALGEVAEYIGNKLDVEEAKETKEKWLGGDDEAEIEYDVNVMDESRIQEAFDRFDEDGNGEISAEELQRVFTLVGEKDGDGKSLTLEQVKKIVRRFDDNNDGVLQYEEFAQLWMAKRRSAMSESALRRAVVVCGYNEVGQQLCAQLDKANIAGIPYVAFARKTEQISASVADGTRVVYGDGTSGALIRAAGVQNPTAIAITYQESERCLSATEILRESFPDTPIFVRADNCSAIKKLIKAGATEVICATNTVASGMGMMLGMRSDSEVGAIVSDSGAIAISNMATALYPPLPKDSDEKLRGLAEEIDSDGDREENRKLYQLFSTSLSLDEDGKAQLSEVVNELLRTSDFFVTDEQVAELLGCESLDDSCSKASERRVTFSEFVDLYRKNVALGKK